MKRGAVTLGRSGFTLVEVLVGLALLAVLGGALSALQVGTLRANRNAQLRLQAAALLADELALQRVLGGAPNGAVSDGEGTTESACAITHIPEEWACKVEARCLPVPSLAPCAARLFTVELRQPSGASLRAHGARFRWPGGPP